MQFSNGLSNPVGLWLGHAMFDSIFVVIVSTIITIVFAAASNQFHGLGFVVSIRSICARLLNTKFHTVAHPNPLRGNRRTIRLRREFGHILTIGRFCHRGWVSDRHVHRAYTGRYRL